MNDFLTSLAARTLGQAPVVSPRLPSRFEPLAGDSGYSFGETQRLVDREERARGGAAEFLPVTPSTAGLSAPNVSSDLGAKSSGPADERRAQTQFRESANGATPVAEGNAASNGHALSGSTRIAAAREGTRESPGRFSIPAAQPIRPRAPTVFSRPSPTRTEAASAPTIHVSIGRVEVRAIHRAESARPARIVPHAKRTSLGDYLRQQRD
ncbi:MAG: hypothetical protein ABIV50_06195 [Opitutus sp.]